MQQRLAVASVLVLALLAAASAALIQMHAYGHAAPSSTTQPPTNHVASSDTPTNSTNTSSGSLLTTGSQVANGIGDDGNETEHAVEAGTEFGSTAPDT